MIPWWFSTPEPVIEEAVSDDFDALADLHERAFPIGWSADEISRLAAQPGVTVLKARRASYFGTRAPLGFVIVRVAADEGEILTIAVEPRQRGRGIGGRLMRTVLHRLYGERVASLFLEVDAANDAALALYRRLGFRKVGERKAYYQASEGDGGALVMRVDLAYRLG
ncbi:MAG: ribosomal-protein-alanine N-acetyltransferase [Stappia sp.]|uniref:ribosomal protein S18-alanine N-acetyltransferase n=1 Tax=Stappia sp. TaxID=1870903 RepID=UPI000C51F664|nr:ribosomal protein S18-alanine N-acetyltransferase [Stappia sp.]MAA99101.1 ribosomal-protein-alanine N-acetyltransferase [Stappia sp.]MBM19441.1 ribosomal-protein-alanine N-acetyltransferase [Stappia sp.]